GGRLDLRGVDGDAQHQSRCRGGEGQKVAHYDPLPDWVEVEPPGPPPRNIVTMETAHPPGPLETWGSNRLTSLSMAQVRVEATDESGDSWPAVSEVACSLARASCDVGTRLRRVKNISPILLARAMISLCLGVTSKVAVWATTASPGLLSIR